MTERRRRRLRDRSRTVATRNDDSALAPGWYVIADEGIERWHDQYGWSEHTRPIQDR